MADNPLKQYFRQPKIYVGLPSRGVYNKIGTLQGDPTNMPVFGMTGMDEILMRTPDALMTGESTVKVIESCCPVIKDAWELTTLDTDLIFTAIRIATFGNKMEVTNVCTGCETENEYELDLSTFIEHFSRFEYNNKIVTGDLIIKLQPLTYKLSNQFSLKNFALQQQLRQSDSITDPEEQKTTVSNIFKDLSILQNEIFTASIESVEMPTVNVSEPAFIKEWLENCDKEVFDFIKDQFETTRAQLDIPPTSVVCSKCNKENFISILLDQANFFVNA